LNRLHTYVLIRQLTFSLGILVCLSLSGWPYLSKFNSRANGSLPGFYERDPIHWPYNLGGLSCIACAPCEITTNTQALCRIVCEYQKCPWGFFLFGKGERERERGMWPAVACCPQWIVIYHTACCLVCKESVSLITLNSLCLQGWKSLDVAKYDALQRDIIEILIKISLIKTTPPNCWQFEDAFESVETYLALIWCIIQ